MATFFNCIACGVWDIRIPEKIKEIKRKETDDETSTDDLVECFKFYASMIDRMGFLVIVTGLIVNFVVTFSIVGYNYNHASE